MTRNAPLILASRSASRQAMLTAAGVPFDAVPANADEDALTRAMLAEAASPRAIADALAELKAVKVSLRHPHALVIGSDSVVALHDALMDKPASRGDAHRQLRAMSGGTLRLSSAVVLARGGRPIWRHVEQAVLTVRQLSDEFIAAYLDAEWPAIAATVGAFRLEATGIQLFDRIAGDHFAILGMPLVPLLRQLRMLGVLAS